VIVAIIWKLAVVRITQLFCSDRNHRSERSDHLETSLNMTKHAFRDSLQGLNIQKVLRLFPLVFIFAFLLFPVLRTSELKSCIKRRL